MIPESAGPVAGKRALTVCAYVCGDTGAVLESLETEMIGDLQEMEAAGATQDMAVCVQLDRDTTGTASRYILREGPGLFSECTRLGPVNMGSVDALTSFLDWAIASYPAENFALIVGSHGSGPKADPIYGVVDRTSTTVAESAQVGAERAIAFDDGARSFLSIPDLRRALEHGVEKAGKPFAVILMDACFMCSVEVLHELQGLADYIVASPEAVPGSGLPYQSLLLDWGQWAHEGDIGKYSLARFAVDDFRNFYQDTSETASLLAVDMGKVHALVTAMDALGKHISYPGCGRPIVDGAVKKAERTSDPDFVYLDSLMVHMRQASTAAQGVTDAEADAISAEWGTESVPWGITVYLPRGPVPAWYSDLRVSSTPWGKWVRQYVGS